VTAPDVEAMPNDQGGADAPWGPLGKAGRNGDFGTWFGGIRNGESGDDREATDRATQIMELVADAIRNGGLSPNGGDDRDGWGAGEPSRQRVFDVGYVEDNDELLNHPQAMVVYVGALVGAFGHAGASGSMMISKTLRIPKP
jgi:hypothetical protein